MISTLRSRFFLLAAPATLLLLAACGDDHAHGAGGGGGGDAGRPTCDEIGELCHESTTDLGQECHEFGEAEASTEEQCKEREEECKGECQ